MNMVKFRAYDFFDTIVHRDCNPEVVLYEWANKMERELEFKYNSSDLYRIRKISENNARRDLRKEEVKYEELMKWVYDSLEITDISLDKFVQVSLKLDIEAESNHCLCNSDTINEIKDLYNRGDKIVVISDFYAGKALISSIAKKLKFDRYIYEYFVSSDCGCRKSSGRLYEYVLERYNIEKSELSMKGDNINSDVKIPMKIGIDSVLYECDSKKKTIFDEKELQTKLSKYMNKGIKVNPLRLYIQEISYFVDGLYRNLIRDNVRCVCFCSREGQMLKLLFDTYQTLIYGDVKIKSKYLLVSRAATLLPSLDALDKEDFSAMFCQYKKICINDFMRSLQFNDKEINEVLKYNGINAYSEEKEVDNEVVFALKKNLVFRRLYEEKRITQKDNFLKYIEELECSEENYLNIVDIGWKGTIQDNIQRIVGNKKIVRGYYLGIIGTEYGIINDNCKTGILFSDVPVESKNNWIFKKRYAFYEKIFTADHGPVLSYSKEKDEKIVPIIGKMDKEEAALYEFIKQYQKQFILDFKYLIIQYWKNSVYLPYDLAYYTAKTSLYRQCCLYPKMYRFEHYTRELFVENFGNISKKIKENKIRNVTGEFLFADYSYKILDKMHLSILKPFANIYCFCVYLIKKGNIEK